MTFGTAPFGISPFGGAGSAISIARAWATSTRTVRVITSAPAAAVDPFNLGDALNPRTWIVTRLDISQDYTPIAVRHMGGLTAFEVTTLETFGSHGINHRVASTELRAASLALITAPYQAIFDGVDDVDGVTVGPRRRPRVRDLANPLRTNPLTGDVLSAIQTQAGNYRGEVDAAVVYKGILRRLTTERGSMRDLPSYGVSYRSKVLVPQGGDLTALTVEVERQVMREPGVRKVRCNISVPGRGVVLTQITAGIVGGQLSFAVRRNSDGTFEV